MGSEGPSAVTVHITGFKKFHGVADNPTETIVNNLNAYMQKTGLPKALVIGSCSILETAGERALPELYKFFEASAGGSNPEPSSGRRIILLHFGVNSGATKFAIEHQAVNEDTFRCPDELGWKPQKVPIVYSDESILRTRQQLQTSLPVYQITKALAKEGYEVISSEDSGRFVCNYVYYQSLRFAEKHGVKSLFVHVPLFSTINQETQMKFVYVLLEVLASLA